jgi:hypothetical protein
MTVLYASAVYSAEGENTKKTKVIFCKDLDENLKPKDEQATFDTNIISWRIEQEDAFGVPQLTVSLYNKDGVKETFIKREKFDVRPTWNQFGVKNMTLPGKGEYILSVEGKEGVVLGDGSVTVGEAKKDAPEVKQETLGATLGKLFDKYAPKKD